MTDINQNNPQNNDQPQELRYQNFDNYQQQEQAKPPNNQDQQQNNQNQNQEQIPPNKDYTNQPLLDNRPQLQDNNQINQVNQTNQNYQNYTPQSGNYQPALDPVAPMGQPYPQQGGPMVSPVAPPMSRPQPNVYPMVQPNVYPMVQPNPGVMIVNQDPFYNQPRVVQNYARNRIISTIIVVVVIVFIVIVSVVFNS